ncbi:FadR/GntR family transcriptional regulator [Kribbella italica]|uniref:DNA-binding FadR family transcriptional regulator n=1 Tax=Kribbella italica TaxID=1540520 RepID=A0A7W9JGD4_9ACTN|nr:FCD domain-containing protein [Kribbella italica]MBB5841656.1 DNA-binding FadR family transcriptional regulator [Kribbella italica]
MTDPADPGPRSRGLHGRIVDAIGQRIAHGDLPVGGVVSPEQVEAEYAVSRSVVREALRTLEVLGMVRPRHKVGTTVQPQTAWALLDPQVIGWRSDGPDADRQLSELLALREAVEPVAASMAAREAAENLADRLSGQLQQMREAYETRNRSAFVTADTSFHRTMLAGSNNAVLSQLVQTLLATLHARYSDRHQLFTDDTPASLQRHERVVEAIAARDSKAAEAAATALVRASRVEVLGPDGAQ